MFLSKQYILTVFKNCHTFLRFLCLFAKIANLALRTKVHVKCSAFTKNKKNHLYHPKNNSRYYSMRNLVQAFPFYIDLTKQKILVFFLAGPQCSLVKIYGRNSLLKLPKTLHRLWVDKREVELWRNIVEIDLIKVNWQPNQRIKTDALSV